MDSSRGFGSNRRHQRPLQTRFPSGPPTLSLVNLRRRITRRIILQKARHQPLVARATVASDCLWVRGFRVSFIPLSGCFSPFPHGTGPLSVTLKSLALEGGPPCFPQDFTCPVVLRITARSRKL